MPLFWLSLAFLTGILLAANLPLPTFLWILLAIVSLLFLLPPVYRRWSGRIPASITAVTQQVRLPGLLFYPLLITFISLGALRFQLSRPMVTPSSLAFYNDRAAEYIMQGVIVDPPDERDSYTNLRVQVDQLRSLDATHFIPVRGLLLARIPPASTLHYGDRIRLEGQLETPPENKDFSYRDYLAHQTIYSYLSFPQVSLLQPRQGAPFYSALYSFRDRALDVTYRLFPDPEASLIAGIVLGEDNGIPEGVQEAFRATGTSHIIVISGFNITIIAGLFTWLFSRYLGMFRGAAAAAIGIIIYTLLVGANPAVVRAAILGILALGARMVGRQSTGINSLVFAAAIMAFFHPYILWDVSFQLSFAATLGIMLYAEPFTESFTDLAARRMNREKAKRIAAPVGAYFLMTLAAQLTTLPLMIFYFKRISLSSLIANPLVLPAQPPLMILGGLAVFTGTIFQPLGQLFAWAALPFSSFTIRVVEWLSSIPHGSITLGQVALPLLILFYCGLFAITFISRQLPPLLSRLKPVIPLALMAIITFMVWKAAFYAPDGLMHVSVLDVGTCNAVLIQSPAGRSILINGGSSEVMLSDALGRRLPPFNRSLDWLVVADIDNEDLSALPGNLERFRPRDVLWAGNSYGTHSARNLWSAITAASIPITPMKVGQSLDLGEGATLEVLSTNAHGGVLLLKWDSFRLLLPMGMDFDAIESLQRNSSMRKISAVLLAESGYAPHNPLELISFLHPNLAILSVAPADRSGLPSPETLENLEGYNLLRTDINGWIELTTDGSQMWVQVERK